MAADLNLEMDEAIDLAEEIGPEDYVFVVRPDGMMKTMLLPSEPTATTDPRIEKLLEFFQTSYEDNSSEGHTIH